MTARDTPRSAAGTSQLGSGRRVYKVRSPPHATPRPKEKRRTPEGCKTVQARTQHSGRAHTRKNRPPLGQEFLTQLHFPPQLPPSNQANRGPTAGCPHPGHPSRQRGCTAHGTTSSRASRISSKVCCSVEVMPMRSSCDILVYSGRGMMPRTAKQSGMVAQSSGLISLVRMGA
mgnify:CR=1 FL=1